eukprot:4353464-Amphidinium_carterae.1
MEGQMVVESIRDWAMVPGAKIAGQPSLLPEITQDHFTAAQQQPVPAGDPAQQQPHQQQQQQQQATATGVVPSLVGALAQAVPQPGETDVDKLADLMEKLRADLD